MPFCSYAYFFKGRKIIVNFSIWEDCKFIIKGRGKHTRGTGYTISYIFTQIYQGSLILIFNMPLCLYSMENHFPGNFCCDFKHISTQVFIHICVLYINTILKEKSCKTKCSAVIKHISHLSVSPAWLCVVKYKYIHFP